MDIIMTFNDDCEWEWGDWEEPYIKAIFEHANIKAAEIYAEDVDDYEQMNLLVKELDTDSGEYIEQAYAIRFFEDCVIQGCLMFAHFLWKVDDCDMTLIDQGIYQIHRREDGTRYCLLLAEET
jgi:hypothetical protein